MAWWALDVLHGIDLPDGKGGFLHDDEQVVQWLEEFRHRSQNRAVPDGA
ncbi:hypothetical protein L083_5848 [Actinoplanes sp. N902-109]|nr:hypothetical protein L083_5848 [Actinoplanes sp. N902-109]